METRGGVTNTACTLGSILVNGAIFYVLCAQASTQLTINDAVRVAVPFDVADARQAFYTHSQRSGLFVFPFSRTRRAYIAHTVCIALAPRVLPLSRLQRHRYAIKTYVEHNRATSQHVEDESRFLRAWGTAETGRDSEQIIGTAVILGAGVAGIVSALSLARCGLEVHVYDQDDLDDLDESANASYTPLTPETVVVLQSLSLNVHGSAWRDTALISSEFRALDPVEAAPRVAAITDGQLYSTYGALRHFLVAEACRVAAGRIHLHSRHTLKGEEDIMIDKRSIGLYNSAGDRKIAHYDLLVGADGYMSKVRLAMVKKDKDMRSQLSYVGPRRYICACNLEAAPLWPSQASTSLTSAPLEAFKRPPRITTSAVHASLAGPIDIVGWPPLSWGAAKYFNIRLKIYQTPGQRSYSGMLSGTLDLFTELVDVVENHGQIGVADTLMGLFRDQLPRQWMDALAAELMTKPEGHLSGATVVTSCMATPHAAPALAIIGDAAHATTPRLGLGVQAAVESAAALGVAVSSAQSLSAALEELNSRRQKEATALAEIDRVAPSFFGEHVPMGPLRVIIQTAIAIRSWLARLLPVILLPSLAPHPSYIAAIQAGVSLQLVRKRLMRETALVSAALFAALASFFQYFYTVFAKNRYMFG